MFYIRAWHVIFALVPLLIMTITTIILYQRKQRAEKRLRELQVSMAAVQEGLNELSDEKEWLLGEMHHRVKNNLQTIVSLLESQAKYVKNIEALSAISDSQNRINAMSIIHHKLFQSQQLTSIGVQSYLPEIVQYLKNSFSIRHQIAFVIDVQSLDLDVTQAIPIGLIVNEAVTNAIKYAFPVPKQPPQIFLEFIVGDSKNVTLRVRDNGSGLPVDFNIDSEDCGLGITLMKGLTEDIEGDFEITSHEGVTIEVTFTAIAPLGRSLSV